MPATVLEEMDDDYEGPLQGLAQQPAQPRKEQAKQQEQSPAAETAGPPPIESPEAAAGPPPVDGAPLGGGAEPADAVLANPGPPLVDAAPAIAGAPQADTSSDGGGALLMDAVPESPGPRAIDSEEDTAGPPLLAAEPATSAPSPPDPPPVAASGPPPVETSLPSDPAPADDPAPATSTATRAQSVTSADPEPPQDDVGSALPASPLATPDEQDDCVFGMPPRMEGTDADESDLEPGTAAGMQSAAPGGKEAGTGSEAERPVGGGEELLSELLHELIRHEGSDLHIKVGEPPVYRIHGSLTRSERPMLAAEDTKNLLYSIMNAERQEQFEENKELDMSYSVSGLARFRVNVFKQSDVVGAVLRVIPFDIKGFDELGLPAVTRQLCELQRGLVLVTGPTGSGKSTSLAAMIDYINSTKHLHIITIEDPIEFLHQDRRSTINQRELGADTKSFASALRHVMRQNPDVILVGELRDLETISQVITAAETGHLVFATLHTTDAAQTIDRIIDVFPPDQQQQVRLQLSTSLSAVVSQTLLPRVDGQGRVAAFEVLVCHSGVRNIIREGKTHQIYTLIQTGSQYGMQLLDQNLRELLRQKVVSFDEVIAKSSNPGDFEHLAPS